MRLATRIERDAASGTTVTAAEIRLDRQLRTAAAAEHCLLFPLVRSPTFRRVSRLLLMAVVTAVIRTAALKLDCYDIGRTMVMAASRLTVDRAVHVRPAFDTGVPFGKAVHAYPPFHSRLYKSNIS